MLGSRGELTGAASIRSTPEVALLLGDDLLPWLVLAFGAALALGTALALVRGRPDPETGELEHPPAGRSAVMIGLGTIAALWGLASLLKG
jgi:hypothetical protein